MNVTMPFFGLPAIHCDPPSTQIDRTRKVLSNLFKELVARDECGRWLDASAICRDFRSTRISGSCVLDLLVTHADLIPETLRGKTIFFHGRCRFSGGQCIRYLYCDNGTWRWSYWQGDSDGTKITLSDIPSSTFVTQGLPAERAGFL